MYEWEQASSMEPFLQYEWLVAAAAAVSTGKRVFSAIEILKKKKKKRNVLLLRARRLRRLLVEFNREAIEIFTEKAMGLERSYGTAPVEQNNCGINDATGSGCEHLSKSSISIVWNKWKEAKQTSTPIWRIVERLIYFMDECISLSLHFYI